MTHPIQSSLNPSQTVLQLDNWGPSTQTMSLLETLLLKPPHLFLIYFLFSTLHILLGNIDCLLYF